MLEKLLGWVPLRKTVLTTALLFGLNGCGDTIINRPYGPSERQDSNVEFNQEETTPAIEDIFLNEPLNELQYCKEKQFRSEPLDNVKRIREINQTLPIEVDGCMNPKNAKLAKAAGANIFVSGSYILKSNNVDRAINELKEAISANIL